MPILKYGSASPSSAPIIKRTGACYQRISHGELQHILPFKITLGRAIMKVSILAVALAFAHGSLASCGWTLKPNDCICMNSVDGSLMDDETATCCRNMGLRTKDNVRGRWTQREKRGYGADDCV
jgi:hypothetical protein